MRHSSCVIRHPFVVIRHPSSSSVIVIHHEVARAVGSAQRAGANRFFCALPTAHCPLMTDDG